MKTPKLNPPTPGSIEKIDFRDVVKGAAPGNINFLLRSRGLSFLEKRLGKNKITGRLNIALKERPDKPFRLLEIGFGEGRFLLDILDLFPQTKIELYGINRKKEATMSGHKDLIKNARLFGLKIPKKNLPKTFFYDAGAGLKFKDNFFDLIISQTTFIYIEDKAKAIEEVWRVLKPGGTAIIQFDHTFTSFSKECAYPEPFIKKVVTPRFLIYKNNKLIDSVDFFYDLEKAGYGIKLWTAAKEGFLTSLIKIEKNSDKPLRLGLRRRKNRGANLNGLLTGNIVLNKKNALAWNGRISVYDL